MDYDIQFSREKVGGVVVVREVVSAGGGGGAGPVHKTLPPFRSFAGLSFVGSPLLVDHLPPSPTETPSTSGLKK